MKKKVCLITGGAGFLGKKYCEFFLKNDYFVFCIDNNKKKLKSLKTYYLRNIPRFSKEVGEIVMSIK